MKNNSFALGFDQIEKIPSEINHSLLYYLNLPFWDVAVGRCKMYRPRFKEQHEIQLLDCLISRIFCPLNWAPLTTGF